MSDEKIFVDGMICKRHPKAPDFVKVNLSLKMSELIAFAKQHHNDGWLNVQVKESQGGKLYAELDTWKPQEQPQQAPAPVDDFEEDSIPF